MKKRICLLFISILCAGCAGTPPRWWNPRGAYPSAPAEHSRPAAALSAPASTAASAYPFEPEPIASEESVPPLPDSAYEEMILTPLQDEEAEEPSNKNNNGATMNITPSADSLAPEETIPLVQNAPLPLPSVLE